jgi:hypothetical protein
MVEEAGGDGAGGEEARRTEAETMNVEKLTEDQAQKSDAFTIEVKVYENGSQIVPSAATVTVKDPDGTAQVAAETMTILAGVGTLGYELPLTYTGELWENATIEVAYTVASVVYKAFFFFDVVLQKLKATVTDDDLKAYFPQLADEIWTDEASFSGQIDEAFRLIKRMIKDKGRRPAMLLDGTQIRELVILKTFEMIFFNFAKSETDIWWARHLKYSALFDKRFESLRINYDEDESGGIDSDEARTFAQPTLER